MLNSLAVSERDAFYQRHGDFVNLGSYILFEDGATDENSSTGMGRLTPPPEDKWERATLIAQFWQTVAQARTELFNEYKSYLGGTGKRRDEWAALYTEEDQLAHLQELQTEARRARARYSKAKRDAEAAKPNWIAQQQLDDAEDAARKQRFRDRLESIKL